MGATVLGPIESGGVGMGWFGRVRRGGAFAAVVGVAAGSFAVGGGAEVGATVAPPSGVHLAYGWGRNIVGELGSGATDVYGTPAPVSDFATDVRQVATASNGNSPTGAALHSDGSVWTWGDNDAGALGDGSSVRNRYEPGQVPLPAAVQV